MDDKRFFSYTARVGGRNLQSLSPTERANIIHTIADQLVQKFSKIMEANEKDLAKACLLYTSPSPRD